MTCPPSSRHVHLHSRMRWEARLLLGALFMYAGTPASPGLIRRPGLHSCMRFFISARPTQNCSVRPAGGRVTPSQKLPFPFYTYYILFGLHSEAGFDHILSYNRPSFRTSFQAQFMYSTLPRHFSLQDRTIPKLRSTPGLPALKPNNYQRLLQQCLCFQVSHLLPVPAPVSYIICIIIAGGVLNKAMARRISLGNATEYTLGALRG